jgi:hypothetical protein
VDTTPAAITKDLEEIHAKGIEGVILYDATDASLRGGSTKMALEGKGYKVVPTKDFPGAHSTPIPGARMPTWTPHSREMYRFAAKEAARLGVKLCVSVGLAGTSGPITPEYGQQKLLWSETDVAGPQTYDGILPSPNKGIPATARPAGKMVFNPSAEGKAASAQRPVAVLAVPDKEGFGPAEVIDLSTKTDAGGRLRWNAPAGQWKILRFAYAPTGMRNSWGLYTDSMSAEALDKTWEVTIGQMLKEMNSEERKGLFAVEDDSWESGEATWTGQFASEFRRLRHYDLIPWLPALVGKKIGGPDGAEAAKRDFYRTMADLIAKNHYAHLRELANREGLVCFSEAAGPNSAQLDDMLNCKGVDFAMGSSGLRLPIAPRPSGASCCATPRARTTSMASASRPARLSPPSDLFGRKPFLT